MALRFPDSKEKVLRMEQMGAILAILGSVLGAAGVVASIILGMSAYKRAHRQDIASGASMETAIRVDIDYIKRGIDDIKAEHLRMHEDFIHLSERVTRVEESVKSAHKRLDQLIVAKGESAPCREE